MADDKGILARDTTLVSSSMH